MKVSWRLLREIINKKKSGTASSRFVIDGKITTDKKLIADGFNSFFVNVGPNLAGKIPSTDISPTRNLNRNLNSMFLSPVQEKEVEAIIKSLKVSSAGWDNVSACVVKKTYELVITPLSYVMNLSITRGIFPMN